MQEFSFTVQLPDWWFKRRSPVHKATTWLLVYTKESSFMYSATKSLVVSCKNSVFTMQPPDWWFVRRSPVLQRNYFESGFYEGVQFYSVTKRLVLS
jgi:hypothetical protein